MPKAKLKTVFQKGAQLIRKGFKDVPQEIVYRQYVSTIFTPGGLGDPERQETLVTTLGFIHDYSVEQIDNASIQANDRMIQIMALDLADIRPSQNDRVEVVATSELFEIITIKSDPAEAQWMLQVREP